jgi:uncharacterized membrane protein YbhN (UPF0104 family)
VGTVWTRAAGAVAVVGVLAVVVWSGRAELSAVGPTLRGADPRWVGVLGVLLAGWLLAWWAVHVTSLGAQRRVHAADLPVLARASLAAVALNSAVKSGGAAGLVALQRAGRRRSFPDADVRTGYLLATTAVDVGFLLVLAAAMTGLVVDDGATRAELAATGAFLLVTVVRAGLLVAAARSRVTVGRVLAGGERLRALVLRRPRRPVAESSVTDLVTAARALSARPLRALPAVLAATAVDLLAVGMLVAAVAAVGGGTHPALALVAYVLSAVAATLGPLPGGLGAAELGAVGALVAGGLPVATATAATLLFRVAEFWVPLLVGGVAWTTWRMPARRVQEVAA